MKFSAPPDNFYEYIEIIGFSPDHWFVKDDSALNFIRGTEGFPGDFFQSVSFLLTFFDKEKSNGNGN